MWAHPASSHDAFKQSSKQDASQLQRNSDAQNVSSGGDPDVLRFDGSVVIVTASLGVLKSNLIAFEPPLYVRLEICRSDHQMLPLLS